MGADACPVPEGEGSWLFEFCYSKKLTTEAPVNGGRNYPSGQQNNDRMTRVVIKFGYMLESLVILTLLCFFFDSK